MTDHTDHKERDQPDRRPIVDLDFLQGLISAVDASGIDSLEISRGGTRIRIAKTAPPAHSLALPASAMGREAAPAHAPHAAPAALPAPAAVAAPVVDSRLSDIKSPMVGTFYRSSSPDTPSYVEVGSRVSKGQTLCILEAMKLMNELQAEIGGVIREVCVENAEPVEYGQVLFRIEPEA
jgi:acetyl-CoA carboxylase biotin carboxyl carrier protein